MWREYISVSEGQAFAGGVLTKEGAEQVNSTRAAITKGSLRRQTLGERLASRTSGPNKPRLVEELIGGDKKIYPWLK